MTPAGFHQTAVTGEQAAAPELCRGQTAPQGLCKAEHGRGALGISVPWCMRAHPTAPGLNTVAAAATGAGGRAGGCLMHRFLFVLLCFFVVVLFLRWTLRWKEGPLSAVKWDGSIVFLSVFHLNRHSCG